MAVGCGPQTRIDAAKPSSTDSPAAMYDGHAHDVRLVGARLGEHREHVLERLLRLGGEAPVDDGAVGVGAVLPADVQRVRGAAHEDALAEGRIREERRRDSGV